MPNDKTPPQSDAVDPHDPEGLLKKYPPTSSIGKEWARHEGIKDKRSPGERAADGALGDMLYTAMEMERRAQEAAIEAATTPEATERAWQKLKQRIEQEGLLDNPKDRGGNSR